MLNPKKKKLATRMCYQAGLRFKSTNELQDMAWSAMRYEDDSTVFSYEEFEDLLSELEIRLNETDFVNFTHDLSRIEGKHSFE